MAKRNSSPAIMDHVEPYYLTNFQTVLEDVENRCGDLLRPEEAARIQDFLALPAPARRLYVRMLTRRGPWFRLDDLAYPEVPDLAAALEALRARGFATAGAAARPEDRVGLLRRSELEARLGAAGAPWRRSETRAELQARLLASDPGPGPELTAPLGLDWVRLLFLLFFGNGEQMVCDVAPVKGLPVAWTLPLD
jgi:hypothetical protein